MPNHLTATARPGSRTAQTNRLITDTLGVSPAHIGNLSVEDVRRLAIDVKDTKAQKERATKYTALIKEYAKLRQDIEKLKSDAIGASLDSCKAIAKTVHNLEIKAGKIGSEILETQAKTRYGLAEVDQGYSNNLNVLHQDHMANMVALQETMQVKLSAITDKQSQAHMLKYMSGADYNPHTVNVSSNPVNNNTNPSRPPGMFKWLLGGR